MGIEPEKDPVEVSILDVLTDFWLSVIRDTSQPTLERLNASEKLAKYRLTGTAKSKKPVDEKFSTKELMALAQGYEDEGEEEGDVEVQASDPVVRDESVRAQRRPRPREADVWPYQAGGRAGQ